MRRLAGSILLLLVLFGVGGLTITVHADTGGSIAPIGLHVHPHNVDLLLVFEEAQQTPEPQDTPAQEEQTYGGFQLDYIIALAVLGGLTVLSMVLGRIAKKNRKRN